MIIEYSYLIKILETIFTVAKKSSGSFKTVIYKMFIKHTLNIYL